MNRTKPAKAQVFNDYDRMEEIHAPTYSYNNSAIGEPLSLSSRFSRLHQHYHSLSTHSTVIQPFEDVAVVNGIRKL
jgi:hypothetical protein